MTINALASGWRPLQLPLSRALAIERTMLDELASSSLRRPSLMLWNAGPALVVPQRLTREDQFESACKLAGALGYPVLVRETGGDVVPQGDGILNISLAFSLAPTAKFPLERAYRYLVDPVIESLRTMGINADLGCVENSFCDGKYNIKIGNRKVAGAAQRWRRSPHDGKLCVLAHALMMIETLKPVALEVINAFYEALGSPKSVRTDAHIGLTQASRRRHLKRAFLRALVRNYAALDPTVLVVSKAEAQLHKSNVELIS